MDMAHTANPAEEPSLRDFSVKQTFEWRASDAFADTYLLMAALCCAARHGLEAPEALEVAQRTFVELGVNIHDRSNKQLQESLEQLPASCAEAADELEKDRAIYTSEGVFSDSIIDYTVRYLKAVDEDCLRQCMAGDGEALKQMVRESINNG